MIMASTTAGCSLLAEEVWTVFLQHSQLDQSVVCKLLCCSQAMAKLVHTTCAGKTAVRYAPPGMSSFRRPHTTAAAAEDAAEAHATTVLHWLISKAMLLGSLKLTRSCDSPASLSEQEVADSLLLGNQAACASTAAAVPTRGHDNLTQLRGTDQRLLLHSLQCDMRLEGPLLTSLASTCAGTLTSLQVSFLHAYDAEYDDLGGADIAACTRAMAALLHLRELTLSFTVEDFEHDLKLVHGVMCAVQRMSQLTMLHVDQPVSAAHVRSLPKSLVQLDLRAGIVGACNADRADSSHEPADLAHLTGLTCLKYRFLQARDVLPAAVRAVHLTDPWNTLPLVQGCKQSLQDLHILCSDSGIADMPFDELRRLQQLPQLQMLHLQYIGRLLSKLDGFPACQPALPLKHLRVEGWLHPDGEIPVGFLAKLGFYTQLTKLDLQHEAVWTPAAIEVLSGQLQKLPVLSVLTLKGSELDAKVDVKRSQPLLHALVGLSSLRSLSISYWPLAAAASQLSAATQLTVLNLTACLIKSATEDELISGLSHLLPGRLKVEGGLWPSDDGLSESGEVSVGDGMYGSSEEGCECAVQPGSSGSYDCELGDTSSDSEWCL